MPCRGVAVGVAMPRRYLGAGDAKLLCVDADEVTRIPASLWRRIRRDPQHAPEHIALAGAERFGPQAARWVQFAGVGQSPKRLARTAMLKHVRKSRLEGAVLGVGGFTTAAADLVALGWIQSRMVFFIAAAYGYDPRDPMRPAELLALTGFYPSAVEAREALDGMGKSLAQAAVERTLFGGRERTIYERLLRFAGKRLTNRACGRLMPLLASPVGAVQNGAGTKALGRRAIAYYGQARP
jgi:EcsC family protein